MDWKKLGKKLLFPPIWVIIVIVILSTVALVTVFVKGWQFLPVSSVVYVLAFYSLTIFCGLCLQYTNIFRFIIGTLRHFHPMKPFRQGVWIPSFLC